MYLAAIYWAKIPKMYYGCTRIDAANAGFADEKIYKLMKKKIVDKDVFFEEYDRKECLEVFIAWKLKADKIIY